MLAAESFEKRRKMARAESYLRPGGKVEEFCVVNSHGQPGLTAAQIPAGIYGDSEPALKVVGKAATGASRIRFHGAAYRDHSAGKEIVNVRAGIEKGVSAVQLPFGSRPILCSRQRGKSIQSSKQRRQHY